MKSKPNVVYDYQIFSEQLYGGISRYIYELATHVDNSSKYKVNILAPLYINNYLNSSNGDIIKGKHIYPFPKTARLRNIINNKLSRMPIIIGSPEIIHWTYYASTKNQILPSGSRSVVTVHDMTHEQYPEYFPGNDLTSRNKRQSIERADHVICVSNNTRDDLIKFFNVDPGKISVIYHGYPEYVELNQKIFHEVDSPYILYVGQRSGYKNFNNLLSAYYESKVSNDYKLICFGGGLFSENERRKMEKYGLTDKSVTQISGNDAVLSNLYKNASLFIYPSLYEGFGMPLLEAMSHHCPVICSNKSSFPEVAGKAALYFEPDDVDSIIDIMKKVLGSREITNKLITAGIEKVKEYSWHKCSQLTISVYDKLLAENI